jgi:hypothetical protein
MPTNDSSKRALFAVAYRRGPALAGGSPSRQAPRAMALIEDKVKIAELADLVDAALADFERKGLRRGRRDRFSAYTRHLRVAGAGRFPGPLPWADAGNVALFNEAAAQCSVLRTALELAPHVDGPKFREKLAIVLDGSPLPPTRPKSEDAPRNYLLELAVGALLHRAGFAVEFAGIEDLTARVPGLPPIVVECTRPTHRDTLRKGLKHVHHQLKRRADGVSALGLAVIGVDRVFDLNGPSFFRDRDQLRETLHRSSSVAIRRVRKLERGFRPPFFPSTPLAAVAWFTGVFLQDTGILYGVGQLDLFCTGDEHDPRSAAVLLKLPSTISFASIAPGPATPLGFMPLVPIAANGLGRYQRGYAWP